MTIANSTIKVATVLFVLGVAAVALRATIQTDIGVPAGETVWQLSWEAQFRVDDPPAYISFVAPRDYRGKRLIKQELLHPDLKIARELTQKNAKTHDRQITATARKSAAYLLQVVYLIHVQSETAPAHATLDAAQREYYLQSEPGLSISTEQGSQVLAELTRRAGSEDQLVQLIFDFAAGLLPPPRPLADQSVDQVLRTRRADPYGKAAVMVAMCRASNIPARLVTGFRLQDDPDARPSYWLEVFRDAEWVPYDPERGHRQSLPANYLPVRSDGERGLFLLERGRDLRVQYEIYQQDVPQGLLGDHGKHLRDMFDFNRLSLDMRNTLAAILLLPFGVLLTLMFRQFTGLHTFGTFTPTLLGFAAVYADPVTAVIIFSLVAVIGIAGRAAPVTRGLQRTPRLGLVFTLVAITMTFAVSLMDYFNLNPEGHIVLLPMVVLTSVIDRVYRTLDDLGIRQVLLRSVWTALVAVACFFLISNTRLARLVISYPELHFLTLASIYLVSLYKGPRLVDVAGFKWLAADRARSTKVDAQDGPANS